MSGVEYDRILIFGASSSIANYIVPKLNFAPKPIDLVYRNLDSVKSNAWGAHFKINVFDLGGEGCDIDLLISALRLEQNDRLLIINFIGAFGKVQSLNTINPRDVLDTIEANLLPFLNLIKLLQHSSPNSILISFSGGGIGGPNLERTSLGYLSSKGAMGFISEAISSDLALASKSACLIAPGPYPSRMQQAVANNLFPEFEASRRKAESVQYDELSAQKLLNMIEWIIQNPMLANGRIWSALYDDPLKPKQLPEFGHLRRVY
jgi:NADP-dependent 3-hydroxy acid dehydrogenase YdfG